MDKHLTEIELFEYSNNLIENETQLNTITQHLFVCTSCKEHVELEKTIKNALKNSLVVHHQIDLSKKIVHHFTNEKMSFIGIDTKGIIFILLILSGLMLLNQLALINIIVFKTFYINIIFSAIMGLLLTELLFNYRKFKKQQPNT